MSKISQLVTPHLQDLGRFQSPWSLPDRNRDRIERAKRDWQAGRFPQVPEETEFIPLPDFESAPQPLVLGSIEQLNVLAD